MVVTTRRVHVRRGQYLRRQMGRRGIPYTMKLADGRTVFVEVPNRMARTDRSGEIAFTPEGVRFLDYLRALASPLDRSPSPAYLTALREALGLTQKELASRLGRNALSVSRWERGTMRPGRESLAALTRLVAKAKQNGVVLPG